MHRNVMSLLSLSTWWIQLFTDQETKTIDADTNWSGFLSDANQEPGDALLGFLSVDGPNKFQLIYFHFIWKTKGEGAKKGQGGERNTYLL